ncbi:hypothetical protein [Actinotalea sp. JY-7876]|uniref:hypothetical protein n=1 Tax=Actinotalea sp. JY-7876 TaxID=2758442 RepID=UPI0015F5DA8B|nr:hypothetical protein [Actinotalea sp. JY-7876]
MQLTSSTPDGLPLLAAGRHRRPSQGACLMELVSVLAGERWSDAPPCTYPLLARLARLVNDATSDEARPRLALLAPSLVGLRPPGIGTQRERPRRSRRRGRAPDDAAWDLELALLAATMALPHAAPWYQRPLAAALLTCEQVAGPGALRADARAALDAAPDATRWATGFVAALSPRRGPDADAVVELAVRSLGPAGVPRTDALLADLLGAAVALAERLAAGAPGHRPLSRAAGERPGRAVSDGGGPRSPGAAPGAARAPRR